MPATVEELIKDASMRTWKTDGPNRVVKVVSPAGEKAIHTYGGTAKGYVTQEKYLYGKYANELERLLGLRPHELRQMAHVYALERLPRPDEVIFRLTLAFPAGEVFGSRQQADMMSARAAYSRGQNLYARSLTPVMQYYQPGSGMIPQWELTSPIPVAEKVATVTDTLAFPRPNGSIKPYTPHNRGPIR